MWKVSTFARRGIPHTGFFPIWKTARREDLYGTIRKLAVFP
jgi:hypothetical protein